MLRTFLRSEIHRAMVTGGDLNYVGSLTMSPGLLEAADIGVHELVQVVNINNGARIIDPAAAETADPAGSGGAVRLPTERIRTFSGRVDGYRGGADGHRVRRGGPTGVVASAAGVFRPAHAGESNEVWMGGEVT